MSSKHNGPLSADPRCDGLPDWLRGQIAMNEPRSDDFAAHVRRRSGDYSDSQPKVEAAAAAAAVEPVSAPSYPPCFSAGQLAAIRTSAERAAAHFTGATSQRASVAPSDRTAAEAVWDRARAANEALRRNI